MAADVEAGPPLRVIKRETILPDISAFEPSIWSAAYDVRTDGNGFLFVSRGGHDGRSGGQSELTVVVNWFDELRARLADASSGSR